MNDLTFDVDEFKKQMNETLKEAKNIKEDIVNHPKHYNREGAMQCFDEFEMIFGKEAAKYACLFNIWKYRYRSADKNGEIDISKSDWYVRKYKELTEGDEIKLVDISRPYHPTPLSSADQVSYCNDNCVVPLKEIIYGKEV